ncbi:MAG: hypothetical protein ABI361_02075 [Nitrososphaera sp.]|jgi:hypothetical protein
MANNLTIAKTNASNPSRNTTYTINNFTDLTVDLNTPAEVIDVLQSTEDQATVISTIGPTMTITFNYIIHDETNSVVSGAGGTVKTATEQFRYLFGYLEATDIFDNYTFTFDFGDGTPFSKNGKIARITPVMTSDAPITFRCTIQLAVGDVPH